MTAALCAPAGAADFDLSASASFAAAFTGDPASAGQLSWPLAVGDLNGDGKDDIAAGDPYGNYGLAGNGAVYIILSQEEPAPGAYRSLSATTNYLVRYAGAAAGDNLGTSIAIGDVDADGIKDLIIGASGASSAAGSVYVIQGSSIQALQGTGNQLPLSDAANYLIRYGGEEAGDSLGEFNAAVGDVIGDSYPDLVMPAPKASGSFKGSVYVIPSDWIRLSTGVSGTLGTEIPYFQRFDGGQAGAQLGELSHVTLGDINGDGKGDLIMGAPGYDSTLPTPARVNSGAFFVVFSTGMDGLDVFSECDLTACSTCYNIRFDGAGGNHNLGYMAAVGDLDNDGKGDLILGDATGDYNGLTDNGAVYVVLSKLLEGVTGKGNVVDLNDPSAYSYRIDASTPNAQFGYTVQVGDFTGSGRDDLIINHTGDNTLGRTSNGKLFVIKGESLPTSGAGATLEVSGLADRVFHGPATNAQIGYPFGIGDFSGDGGSDLVLSSYHNAAGTVYVVYGSTPSTSGTASAAAASNVVMNSIFGTFTLAVPAGAFDASQELTLRAPSVVPTSFRVAAANSVLSPAGVYLEIVPSRNLPLRKSIKLTMPYRDIDVASLAPSRLIIARYDDASGIWVPHKSEVDDVNRKVTASLDHLSLFGLFQGAAADDGLSRVKAFPNPLLLSSGHTLQRYSNLPPDAAIGIYTTMGELVRNLRADAAGLAEWDGRNTYGRQAASGVYLLYIRGTSGDKTLDRVLKVIVQR